VSVELTLGFPGMTTCELLAGFAIASAGTWTVKRYAQAHDLIDRPNLRSSHTQPTPRGGGVAIVGSFALLIVWWWVLGSVAPHFAVALLGSALPVALIGFFDDRGHVPARARFAVHTSASVLVVWLMGELPRVPMLAFEVDLSWFGLALASVYLVWMVNLVNFMDGIDGIASMEAITVSLGAALCWWLAAPQGP
jgi:Fuc2NAc and GlcNAc transferase